MTAIANKSNGIYNLPQPQNYRNEVLSDYVFGKVPPHDLRLEEAVLGALMLDKKAMSLIADILTPESFYLDSHQLIYKAMIVLYERKSPIDMLTVMETLKRCGDLEDMGGPAYLAALTNKVASAANIEYHARIIQQYFIQRELIRISSKIISASFSGTCDVFDIQADYDIEINRLFSFRSTSTTPIKSLLMDVRSDSYNKNKCNDALIGLPLLGNTKIDQISNGAEPGDFIIFSGDNGSGKSSLFNNIAFSCVMNNIPLFDWSGELSAKARASRLLSAFSKVNGLKIRSGAIFNDENYIEKIDNAIVELSDSNIFFNEDFEMNINRLKSIVANYNRLHNVKVFCFDRLELFDFSEFVNASAGKIELAKTVRMLAKELGVTIIISAQLRKSTYTGKIPTKEDINDAKEITNSATKVFICHRPEMYGINEDAEGRSLIGYGYIILEKNTNGIKPDNPFVVKFHKENTIWENNWLNQSKDIDFLPNSCDQINNSIIIDRPASQDGDIPF